MSSNSRLTSRSSFALSVGGTAGGASFWCGLLAVAASRPLSVEQADTRQNRLGRCSGLALVGLLLAATATALASCFCCCWSCLRFESLGVGRRLSLLLGSAALRSDCCLTGRADCVTFVAELGFFCCCCCC